MNRKNKLLSIGEISKLTGVNIKSLRYYEKINVLKPDYISPDSGYRYYSFNQAFLISLIKFAIEMDIPLREFSKFLDEGDSLDFRAFSIHAKEVARRKIKALEIGMSYIDYIVQQADLQKEYPMESVYTREFPEKYFYVVSCEQTFDDIIRFEAAKLFLMILDEENYEYDVGKQPEYGFLLEHSPQGIKRYIFVEALKDNANFRPIPAGNYHCFKSDTNSIERCKEIFKDYLKEENTFLAIANDTFSDKININKPINELRIIKI